MRETLRSPSVCAIAALVAALAGCGPITTDTPDAEPDGAARADGATPTDADAAADAGALAIRAVPVGTPAWRPAGFVRFAAPLGSRDSAFVEALQTYNAVLRPGHRIDTVSNTIIPAAPHAGPYETELADHVAALGYHACAEFRVDEFSPPSGVYLMFTLVPARGAPLGSTFDGEKRPLLPRAMFPIRIEGELYRDDALFDDDFDARYTGALWPGLDGMSHALLAFGENMTFAPYYTTAPGHYEWRLLLEDAQHNGWLITAPFDVR